MATVTGPPAYATRNKPIRDNLKAILSAAADECGIDHIRISSGGQDRLGHGTRRTGSTRHDVDASGKGGAADLEMLIGGKALNYGKAADRAIVARFVTACVRRGVTGVGAGGKNGPYMGLTKIHAGFGPVSTWGHGGRGVNAPDWLLKAVADAKRAPKPEPSVRVLRKGLEDDPEVRKLQAALNDVLGLALKEDGDFGERTEAAVHDFQQKKGLVPDGVAGHATRALLGIRKEKPHAQT